MHYNNVPLILSVGVAMSGPTALLDPEKPADTGNAA
jgi:hypothetical protein